MHPCKNGVQIRTGVWSVAASNDWTGTNRGLSRVSSAVLSQTKPQEQAVS
ncbi:hypothetical protein VFPFJ_01424 [Purpureocillium lilacinum]|uniref:Uncharacterized protein n=1 Tax=Purpureocillium lilacinum TaxID=33203 RepID=A0A179HZ62_PURLI|nr:hypothetical protein VFPFJ_01424 [Purpureocillium lilacinum]OAQ95314.1 hypothetical protein VFPFJ_01424 [Purpureocillium lilacinum]